MRPFIVALVVGLIATALSAGAVSAADPQATVVAPAPTAAGVTAPSPAPSPDSWRYKFYNGNWWYWTPDNRWLCYVNGQWVIPPAAPVQASVPVYVAPQPYYAYPYGYYPYPYYGGGVSIGFGGGWGWGGGWHGGYGGFHR
ncbi:MAG: hypothetical protein ABSG86_16070 [Thermoguttaceae bacterium]|jgi:hypothetical protein